MNTKSKYTKDIILQLIGQKTKLVVATFFTMLFNLLFKVIAVLTFSQVIESLFVEKNNDTLTISIICMITAVLAILPLSALKKKQASNLSTYITTSLISEAYSSILNSEMNDLEKRDVDIDKIIRCSHKIGEGYIRNNVLNTIEDATTILVIFVTLLVIKPAFALITILGLPLLLVLHKAIEKIGVKYSNKKGEYAENTIKIFKDSYTNIKDIKLDNSSKYEIDKLEKNIQNYISVSAQKEMFNGLTATLIRDFIAGVILVVIIGLSGWLVGDNGIENEFGVTSKVLVCFALFTPQIYYSFKKMIGTTFMPTIIENEVEELDTIINLKSEIRAEPVNNIDDIHSLKFNNVSFKNEKIAFNNLSFELKRGEKLGIYSQDEDFKEAVFDIMTKIVHPKSGNVSINNCDIAKINTSYLRDLITSIYEDSIVLENTIKNNISYPLPFDEYKYNDALNRTDLKDLIAKLELKENTIISKSESFDKDLIHRIIFANAFYKDSKIYLLKDATRDYLAGTETDLLKEIFNLKNKSVIIMSDKIYNVSNVDKILIYENGEVVEYGKTSELLQNKNSRFYKLTRRPSLGRVRKIS